ncbi:XisH family protein [candidate division KSB1 bacterium]|nr:XisH family protein [candidate division KSB1 bacterium]
MPQRDSIHYMVKKALIKEGWEITDDPYVISYGERFLFVDLGAIDVTRVESFGGNLLGARRKNKKIAVEIKEFRGMSLIKELEQAIGQFVLYRLLINKVDPERDTFLAVTDVIYEELFSEPIGKLVISDLPLQLIVINSENQEVKQWITP